eukprot:scaffold246239_cov31-Tisochrysis_lutea.AAC.3
MTGSRLDDENLTTTPFAPFTRPCDASNPIGRHARRAQHAQVVLAVARISGREDGFFAPESTELQLVHGRTVGLVCVQSCCGDAIRLPGRIDSAVGGEKRGRCRERRKMRVRPDPPGRQGYGSPPVWQVGEHAREMMGALAYLVEPGTDARAQHPLRLIVTFTQTNL